MSTLVAAARPGLLLGDRPEKRESEPGSALDTTAQLWFEHLQYRPLSMRRFRGNLARIEKHELELEHLDMDGLERHNRRLQKMMLASDLDDEIAECSFAAIRRSAQLTLGLNPHVEQLFAGWTMLHGSIAEMHTGEGKTLTATLPAITVALTGTPVHVVTVNEYLVERDAAKLSALYGMFGLRVGTVSNRMNDNERRKAYAADVVYCTNKQMVFDYLRDLQVLGDDRVGLKSQLRSLISTKAEQPVMRGLCYAIIDEADSVLIDDARTPLILAQPRRGERAAATEAAVALSICRTLHEGADFRLQQDSRSIALTDTGQDALRSLSERLDGVWRFERYRNELVRQALTAVHLYKLDRDYMIREGKIELIDEGTGRVMPDRKLQHGLHRMLEVKEKCEVTDENDVIAALSFQRFYMRYCHLTGMSGTVREVRGELRKYYGVEVVSVPSHKPSLRRLLPTLVACTRSEQLQWLLEDVRERRNAKQPILIGTRSVELSEHISALLTAAKLPHELLNARQDQNEAEVVARGGVPGSITVATNMAGRGTDIPLQGDAAQHGGLHVVNLEINESGRVDRQLFGRGARQGDPGSCQAILSLTDDLVVNAVPEIILGLVRAMLQQSPGIGKYLALKVVKHAQRRCERRHEQQRMAVFKGHDQLKRQLAVGGDRE